MEYLWIFVDDRFQSAFVSDETKAFSLGRSRTCDVSIAHRGSIHPDYNDTTAFNTERVISGWFIIVTAVTPSCEQVTIGGSVAIRARQCSETGDRPPPPHLRPLSVQVVIFVEYSYIHSSFLAISCRPSMYAEKKRLALGRLPDRYIYHNVPITAVKSSVGTESTGRSIYQSPESLRSFHTNALSHFFRE